MAATAPPLTEVDHSTRSGMRPPSRARRMDLARARGSRWTPDADPVELPAAVGFGPARRHRVLALAGPATDPGSRPDADADADADADTAEPSLHRHRRLRLVPALDPGHRRAAVQLTPRGQLAVLAVAGSIGLALIAGAWSGAATGAGTAPPGAPARVVVHDSDTLWDIAVRLSPDRDPRDEVSDLRRLNHLSDTVLTPGQILRTR